MMRPCVGCGAIIPAGSRCPACAPARQINGWNWTATKRKVLARDGHQCTHLNNQGQRCIETHALYVEHIIPIRNGGTDTPDNLTARCRIHRFDTNQHR